MQPSLFQSIYLSLSPSGPLTLCPFLVIKIYFIVCFLCVGHTLFYRCILVCPDASVAVAPPFSVSQVTSGQSLHSQIIQLHQYKGIEMSSKPCSCNRKTKQLIIEESIFIYSELNYGMVAEKRNINNISSKECI